MLTPQIVWYLATLLSCGFAILKGGAPERSAAIACALASLVTPLLLNTKDWFDPQWGVLVVDLALLGALVALALATNRVWLLFASAFQLLGVVIHVAIMVDHGVAPLPYRRGLVIWSYLTLMALGVGTWGAWRESRRLDLRPPP
jgi:hypothetical protein